MNFSKNRKTDESELNRYNLNQDAAAFKYIAEHALWVLGGTLAACNELVNGRARVAFNWCGGRHHALRADASGFCYLNDVVLAILNLQCKFPRVLCIDIDVHQ